MEPLRDSWGREIRSLRVSVTDKCNFRCRYCMPAEGLEWLGREEVLTFEEIQRLVRGLASMGGDGGRLTRGGALVRRALRGRVGVPGGSTRSSRPLLAHHRRLCRAL